MTDQTYDVIVLAPDRWGRTSPTGSCEVASPPPSSNGNWSAASAPTGRACRPRRSCAARPQVSWLASAGIALHRGQGRISGQRTVEVIADGATTVLTARHAVVVATGSSALVPEIAGLREARPWTSREAAAARVVPARLAIIGGGVVATETATVSRPVAGSALHAEG